MSNPLLQPIDLSTGQLITTSNPANQFTAPFSIPAGSTGTNQSFLGADGFLSKAAETAGDLFGLFGNFQLEKARIERIGADRPDPNLTASQMRAGVIPTVITENRVPLYVIGGLAGIAILAGIVIATRK